MFRRMMTWGVPLSLGMIVSCVSAVGTAAVGTAAGAPQENLVKEAVANDAGSKDSAAKDEKKAAEAKKPVDRYVFSDEKRVAVAGIKNQGSTGTCWCFAGTSFLESELVRTGKGTHDLSEMFIVRNVYNYKGRNYVLRQGKATFGQGALAHDYLRSVSEHGVVPEAAYTGLQAGATAHNHGEMASYLEEFLKIVVKKQEKANEARKKNSNVRTSDRWKTAYSGIVDAYLGQAPKSFEYRGKTLTAKGLKDSLGFKASDYVSITSFNHHPYHEKFVLEIPDNFSNGSFLNLPLNEMMEIIQDATDNGFSVAWDGDVSEKGFNPVKGLALNPVRLSRRSFKAPGKEIQVTQEMRQKNFENYVTTDDHLMHMVGTAVDQNGTRYYLIKNSWGAMGERDGYLYMSESYVRQNTIAILVHKDAVPEKYRK